MSNSLPHMAQMTCFLHPFAQQSFPRSDLYSKGPDTMISCCIPTCCILRCAAEDLSAVHHMHSGVQNSQDLPTSVLCEREP